jgi:hypothetical protein
MMLLLSHRFIKVYEMNSWYCTAMDGQTEESIR